MKKMRKFTKSKMIDKLWEMISLLDGPREIKKFLEDVLYPSEISMSGQRLLVAKLLRKGFTYEQISGKTGASMGTINRVWQVMHRGTGGYELAFSILNQQRERIVPQKLKRETPMGEYQIAKRFRKDIEVLLNQK